MTLSNTILFFIIFRTEVNNFTIFTAGIKININISSYLIHELALFSICPNASLIGLHISSYSAERKNLT
jgi:hypothetical protein